VKKLIFLFIALIIIVGVLMSGCGGGTTTTSATSATTSVTTTKPPTTTAGPTFVIPPTGDSANGVYDGTLQVIMSAGPTVLGGFEGGVADLGPQMWGLDAYIDATAARGTGNGLEPVLCTGVDEDVAGKKLVFHLRQGIKFHDGSALNSDSAMWNFQRALDSGRFWGAGFWDGMNKIDDYNFEVHFTEYSNKIIQNWGWQWPRSMEAYMKATVSTNYPSGGDPEMGKIWDRDHLVAAGPFALVEYKRDVSLTYKKFDQYWNAPLPYLDGVVLRIIPDPVAARALMEKGEADYWLSAPAQDTLEMKNAGYKRFTGWAGWVMSIWPNTSSEDSIWKNQDLRYALDYAINKQALSDIIGAGLFSPLFQLAPKSEWGYDPNYAERKYDPAKAREYIAKAGFTSGIKTKLLINSTVPAEIDAGTLIKGYLDAVGIETELDLADPGRFFGTVFGNQPAEGLSFMWSGMDITNLLTYQRWFSTDPGTNLSYLGHTAAQEAIDKECVIYPDAANQKRMCELANKYLNDGAYLIPCYLGPTSTIAQKWVHSQQWDQGFVRWQHELIWMEKH
jgi:ABC-type transport system substrate-binding protein